MALMRNRLVKMLKKNNFIIVAGTALLIIITTGYMFDYKQDRHTNALRIMFYNVENFFDTIDSNLGDEEFLPVSPRKWNSYKYYRKLNNIFKAIALSCNDMNTPDIIGLCEVESVDILLDLCYKTHLSHEGYGCVISAGKDERGINTALIYRKEKMCMISSESWCPTYNDGTYMATRAVLYCRFKLRSDTLDVMVCHWPSRRGGAISSDKRRKMVAAYLRDKVDSLGPERKLLIMGDMNDEPYSESVKDILGATMNPENEMRDKLVNTASDVNNEMGSYKYQGTWYNFDQIIISGLLYRSCRGLYYKRQSYRIVGEDALLTDDVSYKGYRPFGTWWGYNYEGGFSDHLPVTVELNFR